MGRHLLSLASVFCLPLAASSDVLQKKAPPPIAVVRTWGDLFDQPVLTVSDGNKVRVGIEASKVAQSGAFLVYALLDRANWGCHGEQPLGPLHVELVRKGAGKRGEAKMAMKQMEDRSKARADAKHLLFATTVLIPGKGNCELVLRGPDETVVARATIGAAPEKALPWLAFGA